MAKSILAGFKKEMDKQGIFALIAGERMSGKSTLAGTLPGKTAYMQAHFWETGSASALKLAKRLDNQLTSDDVFVFHNIPELVEMLELVREKGGGYDNVYIDGLSAVSEFAYEDPEVQKIAKNNVFKSFDEIKDKMVAVIKLLKELSEEKGVNTFITLALEPVHDSLGNLIKLDPRCKGKAYLSTFTGVGATVLIPRLVYSEDGQEHRELVTSSDGVYQARIDHLLSDENPGTIRPASLATIINLIKGD